MTWFLPHLHSLRYTSVHHTYIISVTWFGSTRHYAGAHTYWREYQTQTEPPKWLARELAKHWRNNTPQK